MSRHVVTRRRRVFGVWFISCVVTRHADPSSSVRRSSSTHVQGRPSTDRTTRMSENPTPQNHSRRSWTSQPSIVVYNVRESHNPERRARRPTSSTTSTARARRPRRRAIDRVRPRSRGVRDARASIAIARARSAAKAHERSSFARSTSDRRRRRRRRASAGKTHSRDSNWCSARARSRAIAIERSVDGCARSRVRRSRG